MINRVEVLSQEKTQKLLVQSFSRETSLDNGFWTPENPSLGHCAVASAVAQDYRGGFMREYFLPRALVGSVGFCTHYVLVLEEKVEDYTKEQFPDWFPYESLIEGQIGRNSGEEDVRNRVLAFDEMNKRYQLLRERFDLHFRLNRNKECES